MNKKIFYTAIIILTAVSVGFCDVPNKTKSKKTSATKPAAAAANSSDKEKAELLKKIDRNFDDAQAHYELGKVYQQEKNFAKAEYEYNTAISFAPTMRRAQAALVRVTLDGGEKVKSQNYADLYIRQNAHSDIGSLELAIAFERQHLDNYAFTCYQQSFSLNPNSARLNKKLGYYYLKKGDKLKAQEHLSRSFQLDPQQPDVAEELGKLGVTIKVPKKTNVSPKKLDKVIEQDSQQKK